VIFSNELARRYGKQGVNSNALNPGNLGTDLLRHLNRVETWILKLLATLHEPSMGALTPLWVGTSPTLEGCNGEFFIPWARRGKPNRCAGDLELGTALWDWMEDQVKNI
jgi:retinol dehydrogenase-12